MFNHYGILGIEEAAVVEFNLLALIFGAMAIIRHKDNIIRLIQGTENNIGKKAE